MLISAVHQSDSVIHVYTHTHTGICIYRHAQSLQSCPTLCSPMDCSPPGSSVHGILQARTLEGVAMPSSRGSSQPRGRTRVASISCITGRFFTAELQQSTPPHTHTYILFYIFFHYGLSQDIEYSSLCYTVGPCCLPILCVTVCIC